MFSRKALNITINWSIEFLPIFVFFVLIWLAGDSESGFVFSAGIFTILTIIALMVAYFREGRIAVFAGFAGAFIIIFGIATVYFDQTWIFMFESTAYYGIFALILLPGILQGKGYLKAFFNGLFDLDDQGWFILSVHYFILLTFIAFANEYIWRTYSQEVWAVSKYATSFSMIVLGFIEIPLGKKHRMPGTSAWGVKVTSKSDKR